MSPEASITFFLAIFIFAITPGPGTFALIGRALASGSLPCLPMALGMIVSDVIYLLLACLGLAVVAEMWSELFFLIRLAGSGYLFYLAWKMWSATVVVSDAEMRREAGKQKIWQGIVQGFFISAANPKVILFYIAFLPTFMDLDNLAPWDLGLIVLLTILGLMSGLMLVSVCASSIKNVVRSTLAEKRMNRIAGSIMAAAGVYLISHG
jgi:threonine/homoserine/homoserine lactone efflux protein